MGEVLIDTNVLVYAHQPAETVKYAQAVGAIETLADTGLGRLTAQVLGEFVSATREAGVPSWRWTKRSPKWRCSQTRFRCWT